MKYFCCDDVRRATALRSPQATLNGIEFLEVLDRRDDPPELRQRVLFVNFLKSLTPSGQAGALGPNNVLIEGGERITEVRVTRVVAGATGPPPFDRPDVLVVEVNEPGDFSTYTLRLVEDAARARAQGPGATDSPFRRPPQGFDPVLSAVDFSFKVLCESDFDCRPAEACPPAEAAEAQINYLAKDYASFRQLMLDRMRTTAPEWHERNPADLGLALVELLAYVGDYLSYRQDAVATESYLSTARLRSSVRRHARLVDYPVDDGSSARVWVQVRVREGVNHLLLRNFRENFREQKPGEPEDAGVPKIFTRFLTRTPETPPVLAIGSAAYDKALAARPQVFEPLHDLPLFEAHNRLRFYTWGAGECCLPRGATRATLRGHFPDLRAGYVLILAEVLGPQTGQPADADPRRRHAVRLLQTTLSEDPAGGLFDEPATNAPVPVTEIEWHAEDALPFPLCVSAKVGAEFYADVSVAYGNVVLADHGLRVEGERLPEVPAADPALARVAPRTGRRCKEHPAEPSPRRYRPRLKGAPLAHSAALDFEDATISATALMTTEARQLRPAVSLEEEHVVGLWRPRRDLLSSRAAAREFVAEVEQDGATYLRFGDGRYGARPRAGARLTATYRIGGGSAGNVGANSLAHVASDDPAVITDLDDSPILAVSNPLAARGGAEPVPLERVRQDAPEAFRTQERAVTTDDYAELARTRCPPAGVQRAAATMRWTGSWHTVFVTADRLGGASVDAEFERVLRRCLERYRMAGHDLEVEGPSFVPLEVGMAVCVKRGYLAGDVRRALLEKFSNRALAGGGRGLFHPDNFSFGQPVFLSALYAAAQSVAGVDSVDINLFQRQGAPASSGLAAGRLDFGRLEIARLDNDPDFPERGLFKLDMRAE